MNERIEKLQQHIHGLNDAGVRRSALYGLVAESLQETVGEPRPLRRAKAFAHLLDHVAQAVLPHERLAGSIVGMWPVAEGLPPYEGRRIEAIETIEQYRRRKRETGQAHGGRRWGSLMLRDHYDASIAFQDLQRLIAEMDERYAGARDVDHREIGLLLEEHFQFNFREEKRLMRELPWAAANHCDLNYGKSARRGLGAIRREILTRLGEARDEETRVFYDSTRIAVEAAIRFIRRYADTLLRERKSAGVDAARAAELSEMADVCGRVAEGPPESFREAIQLVWLVHVIANVGDGAALSFARFDQYMHPFYARDLARGAITRDEAKELLSCLWLKVNEPHMRTVQSLCLAGTRPDGSYGANELTRLCLEVCRELHEPYPNLSVRVSRATPEWLWDEIVETIRSGGGHPMLLNDETWIPSFQRLGLPVEAARDYYNMGCVEMMIQGQTGHWAGAGAIPLAPILEQTFRDAERAGGGDGAAAISPLDSFDTFEQFLDAYIAQIQDAARRNLESVREQERRGDSHRLDPFGSALIDDCLERGLDMYQGGSRFPPIRPVSSSGIATVADSLAAIKKLVFDEKRLRLSELWEILKNDFQGHEALRTEIERRMPCFGNDDPEVDSIAQRVFAAYTDAVHGCNDGSVAGPFVTVMFSYTGHVSQGEGVLATANGRRKGETVSNGIGPSPGKDSRGPTALIHSVTSLGHHRMSGACAFNMRLSPGLVPGKTGGANLKALLKTYIEKGGCQTQLTFVDRETLLEAQEHPDRHRNLIVRVAGYSEYFRNLDRKLQDEIIARTEYGA
ncbi:MAG: pyruvate formate lyase [Candidatus Sumerlaeota bacterium]|nr:pyruvate formate lyase [Candidatus Sumerlaeota bacterium]